MCNRKQEVMKWNWFNSTKGIQNIDILLDVYDSKGRLTGLHFLQRPTQLIANLEHLRSMHARNLASEWPSFEPIAVQKPTRYQRGPMAYWALNHWPLWLLPGFGFLCNVCIHVCDNYDMRTKTRIAWVRSHVTCCGVEAENILHYPHKQLWVKKTWFHTTATQSDVFGPQLLLTCSKTLFARLVKNMIRTFVIFQ